MPLLQVRNLPEDVHSALVTAAKQEHRSVAQQTIVLLRGALFAQDHDRARRQRILTSIKANPVVPLVETVSDPVSLIREDRDR